QALEVQRGTIATLKSMGAALASAVKQPGADEKSVLEAAPFASAFFAPPEAKPGDGEAKPEASPTPDDNKAPPPPDSASAAAAAALTNPAAWWNLLQDQFKSAVSTAMSSDAASKIASASTETAAGLTKAVAKTLSRTAAPVPKPNGVKKAAAKKAAAKPRARKTSAPPQ
ncbi:MAG TPA: hypothetical protein VFF16_09510, partial [Telluria sp.]|nr:hypothetical protein [Telluria sp.]